MPGRTSGTDLAKQKYGENHAKLLSLLDLAWIDKADKPFTIRISPLGRIVHKCNDEDRNTMVSKLILRIPIVQEILKELKTGRSTIDSHLQTLLKKSTVDRRSSTISQLFDHLSKNGSSELSVRFLNIEGATTKKRSQINNNWTNSENRLLSIIVFLLSHPA